MGAPETRYTRSGDVNVACQVVGEGALDLVFIPSLKIGQAVKER